jgi:shikimate dehydrogenase
MRSCTFADAEQAVREADLVVNATSLGMRPGDPCPIPAQWLNPSQVVLDMVYGAEDRTALVTCGQAVGARTLDGLGMLVCQGATAVDIWNAGSQARTPRETMLAAARDELARRATAEVAR